MWRRRLWAIQESLKTFGNICGFLLNVERRLMRRRWESSNRIRPSSIPKRSLISSTSSISFKSSRSWRTYCLILEISVCSIICLSQLSQSQKSKKRKRMTLMTRTKIIAIRIKRRRRRIRRKRRAPRRECHSQREPSKTLLQKIQSKSCTGFILKSKSERVC